MEDNIWFIIPEDNVVVPFSWHGLGIKWSPDGSKFISHDRYGVALANFDGSGGKSIVEFKEITGYCFLSNNSIEVYTKEGKGTGIYRIDIDSTGNVVSKERRTRDYTNVSCPSISPDGKKFVYCEEDKHGQNQIYINELSESLTEGSDNTDPCWSADGKKIIFSSNRDGNYELYSMNPDGSNQRRLTYTSYDERHVSVSPANIKKDSIYTIWKERQEEKEDETTTDNAENDSSLIFDDKIWDFGLNENDVLYIEKNTAFLYNRRTKTISALDIETKKVKWFKEVFPKAEYSYANLRVQDGILICSEQEYSNDQFILSIEDIVNNQKLFRYKIEGDPYEIIFESNILYFLRNQNKICALNLSTGKITWEFNIEKYLVVEEDGLVNQVLDIYLEEDTLFGLSSSYSIDGDRMSCFYVIDSKTGMEKWHIPPSNTQYQYLGCKNGTVLIYDSGKVVSAYSINTGKKLWSYQFVDLVDGLTP